MATHLQHGTDQADQQPDQQPDQQVELAITGMTCASCAHRIERKLGKLDGRPLAAIPPEGAPYALCLIRRGETGQVSFLGEMEEDTRLLARAAKQLVG